MIDKDTPDCRRLAYAAQKTAEACGQCGKPIEPGKPVWRKRISLGVSMWGTWQHVVTPCCADCGISRWRETEPKSCEGCGREVYQVAWRYDPRRTFCCRECEQAMRAAHARGRRAEARGVTRVCPTCGETFEPTRSDSKFCGAACKQKAYRQRVTASECLAVETIESHNTASVTAVVTDNESVDAAPTESRNGAAP